MTLIIVGLYLVYEAVFRYFEPQPIQGWIVVIVAGIALAVDIVTALLTYAMSKESLNVKAAFLHNVSDALASVGVIVAGTLIILYDLYIVDLIVTLVIAGYVLYQGFSTIGRTIRILMGATPEDCNIDALVAAMRQVDGVQGVHHVHVWELNGRDRALEAHVATKAADLNHIEGIKTAIKVMLSRQFRITHSTLEFEIDGAPGTGGDHGTIIPQH